MVITASEGVLTKERIVWEGAPVLCIWTMKAEASLSMPMCVCGQVRNR